MQQSGLGGLRPSRNRMLEAPGAMIGRVIDVHPERYTVDIALADGNILRNVQVCSPSAGTRTGHSYLPTVINTQEQDGAEGTVAPPIDREESDVWAVVIWLQRGDEPICAGFLFPELGQMSFAEQGLYLWRHESNCYEYIDAEGTAEWVHPSGLRIRVARDGTEKRDMEEQDLDKRWHIPAPEAENRVHVYVEHHSGGTRLHVQPGGNVSIAVQQAEQVATGVKGVTASLGVDGSVVIEADYEAESKGARIIIAPGGAITIDTESDASLSVKGDLTATVEGDVTVTAEGNASVTGAQVILGGGSKGVARKDDEVEVTLNIPAGGFSGTVTGKISSASAKVLSG